MMSADTKKRKATISALRPNRIAIICLPLRRSNCRAARRALFLTARDALVTVMVALETASMSEPTLNGSRMFFPLN